MVNKEGGGTRVHHAMGREFRVHKGSNGEELGMSQVLGLSVDGKTVDCWSSTRREGNRGSCGSGDQRKRGNNSRQRRRSRNRTNRRRNSRNRNRRRSRDTRKEIRSLLTVLILKVKVIREDFRIKLCKDSKGIGTGARNKRRRKGERTQRGSLGASWLLWRRVY